MNYRYQWQIIASRVRGLMQAAELHSRFLSVRSSDSFGRTERLREEGERIIAEVSSFGDRFQKSLPREVLDRIEEFKKATSFFRKSTGTPDTREELVWAGLITLSAFEPEISFLLADVQQAIRSRSELALAHLQRSIVVDEEFRKKWQAAFSSGEVKCEALGAVHLLSHGIWAFKVSAEGERTDLVYQEAAARFASEQSNAEGLVLTEWKKAASKGEAEGKFKEARDQAHRYGRGVLAGNELTNYRFHRRF